MSFRTGSDAGDAINTRQTRLLHQRCTGKKHGNDADPRPTLRNGVPHIAPDFSVVLFRPDFMLASEKQPMKAHKNQQLLAMLCPPDSLMEL